MPPNAHVESILTKQAIFCAHIHTHKPRHKLHTFIPINPGTNKRKTAHIHTHKPRHKQVHTFIPINPGTVFPVIHVNHTHQWPNETTPTNGQMRPRPPVANCKGTGGQAYSYSGVLYLIVEVVHGVYGLDGWCDVGGVVLVSRVLYE